MLFASFFFAPLVMVRLSEEILGEESAGDMGVFGICGNTISCIRGLKGRATFLEMKGEMLKSSFDARDEIAM